MQNISPNQKCPRCKKARSEWRCDNSEGFTMEETLYCCEGCALNTKCTCAVLETTPLLERNIESHG